MRANCPVCQRESPLHFRVKDRNRQLTEEFFDYYRCPRCKLIFMSPVPEDLSRYYPDDYHGAGLSLEHLSIHAPTEQYKIDLIKRFKTGGRLLEIGPSIGYFTYMAKHAGFEVEAMEMNAECCRFLERVVGIRTINTNDTKTALLDGDTYDVIALWHVIEHLTEPFATMEAAAARLSPGGLLAIAAPNPDSVQFRLMGRYWTHVDAPRHLFLIPVRLLVERARAMGLKPVLVTTTDAGGIGWNKFGWEQSLFNLTHYWRPRHLLKRIGTRLTSLLSAVEERDMRGSAYTVIFRKGETA